MIIEERLDRIRELQTLDAFMERLTPIIDLASSVIQAINDSGNTTSSMVW
jgi:hypothetical protein